MLPPCARPYGKVSIATRGHLPGFAHPLYPQGDPRAQHLLHDLRLIAPRPLMVRIDALLEIARAELFVHPKNDLAVAAVALVLGLTPDACDVLGRALGRLVRARHGAAGNGQADSATRTLRLAIAEARYVRVTADEPPRGPTPPRPCDRRPRSRAEPAPTRSAS